MPYRMIQNVGATFLWFPLLQDFTTSSLAALLILHSFMTLNWKNLQAAIFCSASIFCTKNKQYSEGKGDKDSPATTILSHSVLSALDIIYCCVINYHKLRDLKQRQLLFHSSQGQESRHGLAQSSAFSSLMKLPLRCQLGLGSHLRVRPGKNLLPDHSVVVSRFQFLTGYQKEVFTSWLVFSLRLSSVPLPCGLFQHFLHRSIQAESTTDSASKGEVTVLCNGISKVTAHCLCYMLVRGKTQVTPKIRGMNTMRQGLLGSV